MARSSFRLDELKKFQFLNYTCRDANTQIHYRDGSISKMVVSPDGMVAFSILHQNGRAKFYHQGKSVEKISLNGSSSSDDLILTKSYYPNANTLVYKPGFFKKAVSMIDFGVETYRQLYRDTDGIDKSKCNNVLQQEFADGTMTIALCNVDELYLV